MTKTISEILSSFDEKFPWSDFGDKENKYMESLRKELRAFLKDSIIDILDGIPLKEKICDHEKDICYGNAHWNDHVKELRQYIEQIKK